MFHVCRASAGTAGQVGMEALAGALRYVNILILAAIALAGWRRWRAGAPGAGWVCLAFASLTALFASRIAFAGLTVLEDALLKLAATLAVLFPYLLFRFSAALAPASRVTESVLGVLTASVVAVTIGIPGFPLDADPRPAWFVVYIVALLVEWAVVFLVVSSRLWQAGRGEPSVARRRMRSLAFASGALVLGISLAALGPGERPPALDLAFRVLVLTSAVAFFVSFAPPRVLRAVWRRPEEDEMRRATQSLIAAAAPEDVVTAVLPPMARIVGARAVALLDDDGRVYGSYGIPAAALGELEGDLPDGLGDIAGLGQEVRGLRIPLVKGSVLVWTTAYSPVFGDEELELLKALGAFAELALDRAHLFAHEREARRVLEQADELKSGFIALASHELRGPATTVYGLAELIHTRGEGLPREQQAEFRSLLHQESARLVRLMDQLLDLSRLEAGAIEISPERVRVRDRLEELVARVARDRANEVNVTVDPNLEAVLDPNALERIVSNLVANALKYAQAPITVAAEQRDRHFRLSVEDRGEGVPGEFAPRLFERFARSQTSGEKARGTGLGLSIAQSYAHAHGGQLLYHPAKPHGAHFELVVPSDRRAGAATP